MSTFGDVAGLDQAIGKLLASLRFEQRDKLASGRPQDLIDADTLSFTNEI